MFDFRLFKDFNDNVLLKVLLFYVLSGDKEDNYSGDLIFRNVIQRKTVSNQ